MKVPLCDLCLEEGVLKIATRRVGWKSFGNVDTCDEHTLKAKEVSQKDFPEFTVETLFKAQKFVNKEITKGRSKK